MPCCALPVLCQCSAGPVQGSVCAMGGAQVQPLTPTPLKHFAPLKGGLGAGRGGGVPGTPTYIPHNDPLLALIILNTHMWGLLEK